MPEPVFHPSDIDETIGGELAFTINPDVTPMASARLHHLALEVVAHLQREGIGFVFRGGTALHTRLTERRRFSTDVDIFSSDLESIHKALSSFTKRFPNSQISLKDPPDSLKVDGVKHTLEFGNTREVADGKAITLLVEVVDLDPVGDIQPLRLQGDGIDWGVDVSAPTFEGFVGQKLAVLGPRTIGKELGPNRTHARQNQSVCKQLFDLRELLRLPLNAHGVEQAYRLAVEETNQITPANFEPRPCLEDAKQLLARLKLPKPAERSESELYWLWSAHRDSRKWIARRSRLEWREPHYRTAGGILTRLVDSLLSEDVDIEAIQRPLIMDSVPEDILRELGAAQSREEAWIPEDIAGNPVIAWAWAPKDLW